MGGKEGFDVIVVAVFFYLCVCVLFSLSSVSFSK